MLTPYAWFRGLADAERTAAVRALLAAADAVDTGLEHARSIWRNRKTARLEVEVSGVGGMALHLVVEGDDPRLLRAFRSRVAAGNLDWVEGRCASIDGSVVPSVSAPLGVGVLVVRELFGELLLSITGKPAISYPEGLVVGKPSPLPRPPGGDGFTVLLFHGQVVLVGGFAGMRKPEVKAARKSPITLAVAPLTPDLCVIGMRVPGLLTGWADLPFAVGVEPPERRQWLPPAADGTMVVLVAVVDRATNVCVAVRSLWMSPKWTAALHNVVDEQVVRAGAYTKAAYHQQVDDYRSKYPRPDDLRPLMTAIEVGHDLEGGLK
jgi:hypothetical protein